MKARNVLLAASLFLLPIALSAQMFGTLTGRIVTESGEPVVGAAVHVLGSSPSRGAYSRYDGMYTIRGIRLGIYDISVRRVSYQTGMRSGVRIMGDSTTIENFVLLADTTIPDAIVVPGSSQSEGVFDRNAPGAIPSARYALFSPFPVYCIRGMYE